MHPSTAPFGLCDPRPGGPSLQPKPKHAITVAVSSWALFNMADGSKIYEEEGLEKYMEYQLHNENVILTPGPAFHFVKVPCEALDGEGRPRAGPGPHPGPLSFLVHPYCSRPLKVDPRAV